MKRHPVTPPADMHRENRLRAIADWENERKLRTDAAAALLHHLNQAALDANMAGASRELVSNIGHTREQARGLLRRTLDEENPYAKETQ